jgi:hypothetical protein
MVTRKPVPAPGSAHGAISPYPGTPIDPQQHSLHGNGNMGNYSHSSGGENIWDQERRGNDNDSPADGGRQPPGGNACLPDSLLVGPPGRIGDLKPTNPYLKAQRTGQSSGTPEKEGDSNPWEIRGDLGSEKATFGPNGKQHLLFWNQYSRFLNLL